ncbi:Prolyl endopeptidase [Acidisarcina polymorpha]|uniref:prolyl oligopeptidase n=1 Tax=Acidisarcina polymorpha TaxID=2211140 RepID=A0A2Z5FZR1_9BACT|nr:prolyl oligopeptidase family serine peptidase [Acidisarcina polymorpha]AXC11836.1 Prolyl endopeptidase [Acidisarcina polymorpha]
MRLMPLFVTPVILLAAAEPLPSTAQDSVTIHGRAGITLPAPPATATAPVVDVYQSGDSGQPVKVSDNYRWLEDAKSPETRSFIAAQNAYTQQYLHQVKILPEVRTQMAALLRVDVIGTPVRRGDRFFFTKRLASENQASIYLRNGLHGTDDRLIDANTLSTDQNTSVTMLDLNDSGSLMAYGLRVGGADELEVHFLDLASRKDTSDKLPSARYYGVQISPDGKGAYYSKFFPQEGTRAFYHVFGTPPESDVTILGGEYRGEKLGEIDNVQIRITENGHFLVLSVGHGVPAKRQDVLLKDLRIADAPIVPLVYGIESRFDVDNFGDTFYVDTDYQAPNHRILKAELGKTPDQWQTIIPEAKDVIEQVALVDGKLYVLRLKDVKSELTVYTLDGKESGKIDFPGVGAGSTLIGRGEEKDGFYSFQSIVTPPTIYHYDTTTGRSEVFAAIKVPFHSEEYEVKEIFYTSKDGTRVPMFIAGRKGLKRDGSERLLMTGYGGFAASETPVWNSEYAWWLQQGGWFALPSLRGGNEYGEAWHKAAMFEKKQNVFDDWFAAAEYLIREKYTSPEHFAIRGRSNGGLLMGASMTQRPDLFGAIWCGYPLLDMLRYQRFLMGRTWTTEYGSAENPGDFSYIYKYSPYQHVVAGTKYPAIMFFTGDGDTRVDPMNARKMTPLMQTSSSSGRPILLHYSLKGGHSAGVSQTQLVEDYADEMAFLWTETGS